jgi:transcriptional regulator with XRE-family HTH domain
LATETVAAHRLREALKPKTSLTKLALQLGVTRQAVAAWASGKARPDPRHWKAIEEILGIPVTEWLDDVPKNGTSP